MLGTFSSGWLLGANDNDSSGKEKVGAKLTGDFSALTMVEGDKFASEGTFDGRIDGASVGSGNRIDGLIEGGSNSEALGIIDGSSEFAEGD